MANLELVALMVRDYDSAIRFFVDLLQFGDAGFIRNGRLCGFFEFGHVAALAFGVGAIHVTDLIR